MELADLFSKKALGDFLNKLFDALLKMAEERMKFNNQRFLNRSQAAESDVYKRQDIWQVEKFEVF